MNFINDMWIEYRLDLLVGGLEHGFYDFPFTWECHHPN